MASTVAGFDFEFIKNNYSSELTIICLTLLTAFILVKFYKRWTKPFPPGPWGLPILGYRPFMGRFPAKQFQEFAKKHGPVMGVSIGSVKLLVLNDYDSMLEMYRREEILARPPGSFYNFMDCLNVSNMNGPIWREHRKFFSGFLRNLFRTDGAVLSLQNMFQENTDVLLSAISKMKKGTDVNIKEILGQGTYSILFKVFFGITLPHNHPFIEALSMQLELIMKQSLPTDWTMCFPKLTWLTRRILPLQQELKRTSNLVEDFIRDQIESHRKNLDPENPKDFIDHSLLREKEIGDKSIYNDGIINGNIQLILLGGTDTTRTALEWTFLLMAKFPEVQENISREIIRVFGRDQKPKWDDRYQLPYTTAAIMEGLRWKTTVPLVAVRMASESFNFRGYWIPKGTLVTANIWAIHNDETYWDNPSEFNPEHYLTKDGKVDLNKRFMAFSYGKRDCPGRNQALMAVFLFLVAVLQKYKILPSAEGVSFEETSSLVASPIKPIVRFEART